MTDYLELKVAMARSQSETGYGRARLDSHSREVLKLDFGDAIEIIGKKTAIAKVFKIDKEDEGKGIIRIDGLTRTSAGVSVDENVKICKITPKNAEKITISPNISENKVVKFEEGIENIFRNGLMNRPLLKGIDILVPNIALMGNHSTFTVVCTEPKGAVTVVPRTEIIVLNRPLSQKTQTYANQATYDDVGGLDDELRHIREMIELPLKHPEIFNRMGISAPKGVLLYGPPGTGKTLIAEAVANESGASFYSICGPEIMGRYYGQSEERLREIFDTAQKNAPSIIFLDEIDSIAPDRERVSGEVERRVVAQLLTLMDGIREHDDIIVIGATNRENSIDPALRRPGRFDREIEIGVPSRCGRKSILEVHTRDMPLANNIDLDKIANNTQGFVGADLAALCRESAMKCLSRYIPHMDLDKPIPLEMLTEMKVTMKDCTDALNEIEPSGMREISVEIPKITWDDIGGLEHIRREICEDFIPTENRKSFERLGIEPGKAILLYGPPGTGKTMIAKAIANESGTNFISISGPEIASKWLGESEMAIRRIFKKAKQMAPCIVFFDEIDSIAPRRGTGNAQTWERVVAQLLTAIDGIESLNNILLIAASNRPDMLDPALLRPGRIDRMILIGKPDFNTRLGILKVHTSKMPLAEDVNLNRIAEITDGYVGADLASLCREAGMLAFHDNNDTDAVEMTFFIQALDRIKQSVSEETFKDYENMGTEIKKRKTNWDDVPFYG